MKKIHWLDIITSHQTLCVNSAFETVQRVHWHNTIQYSTVQYSTVQYNLLKAATNVHARNGFVNVTVVSSK